MTIELHGRKDSDLSGEERTRRDALLVDSAEAREEQALAELLGDSLQGWPDVAPPSLEAVIERVHVRRRTRWRTLVAPVAGLLLAASALLFLTVDGGSGWRDRGVGGEAGQLVVEVAAEGEALRSLSLGEPLRDGERAVLRIQTTAPGFLVVEDSAGGRVHPSAGSWQVGAGRHVPQADGSVLAYAPDGGVRTQTLVVRWCPEEVADERCVERHVRLHWE